ncbi:hypothetical protein EIJ81_00140 (plasmid) [Aliivibrio salmonicida]|uniref:hypothetical protein n=1 Tax=Aliivibrio salmonicida TaxID=40269 RepID=UPI000F6F95B8|nr:hypothetical protein [Aliivibrio salmonicida]AZL83313.1 hypothetical protein EIJ81_00140 [Aliivibrio salmonicida]
MILLNECCPFCAGSNLSTSSDSTVTCTHCKASAPLKVWNMRNCSEPKTIDIAITHLESLKIGNIKPVKGKTLDLIPRWCRDEEVIFKSFDSELNGSGNLVTGYYIFRREKKRLAVNHENMIISFGDNYLSSAKSLNVLLQGHAGVRKTITSKVSK